LDTKNERILYHALKNSGITCVSVGHRPTLLEYHDMVLVLHGDPDSSWSITPAKDMNLKEAVEFMD
jgi:putative ATP-binding cassette transporter